MILVTGGAGYIGSHTVINLLNKGYDVLIFDSLENGHIEIVNILKTLGNVTFAKGDLCRINDIEEVFSKFKIKAVIHFAAHALIEESCRNPQKYYLNNVFGTLNLLSAMIKYNVKKIIFSSSCSVYGIPEYLPIDENHPQNPINPYGRTKLTAEKILQDYDTAYNLKSVILRYFNVAGCDSLIRIGEWHTPETHLIPNILQSAENKEKIFKIFGDDYDTKDGTCIRDYVNAEDLAEAHKSALDYLLKENKSDIFNVGTSHGASIKEVFDICEKTVNKKISVEITSRRTGDPPSLYADSSKIKKILGWKPERSLYKSIQTAFEWEKSKADLLKKITGQ